MSSSLADSVRQLSRSLTHGLLQLIYPAACCLCRKPLRDEQRDFCDDCRRGLTTDARQACPRCASTVGPFSYSDDGCTHCREEKLHFERALRLGEYQGVLRQAILKMKHLAGDGLAEAVGLLWAEHAEAQFQALKPDAVTPIPLHWARRIRRGYNQSGVLAQAIADRLRLPCLHSMLTRTRNTPHQVHQTAAARRQNVIGAFWARPSPALQNRTILLIDDVITTGTTASEAAKALRKAGASRVLVAVLAHSQT